jgi:hypothetical protein
MAVYCPECGEEMDHENGRHWQVCDCEIGDEYDNAFGYERDDPWADPKEAVRMSESQMREAEDASPYATAILNDRTGIWLPLRLMMPEDVLVGIYSNWSRFDYGRLDAVDWRVHFAEPGHADEFQASAPRIPVDPCKNSTTGEHWWLRQGPGRRCHLCGLQVSIVYE